MPSLDRIRVVLLRPRNPENLGAVARAMKNFGLSRWILVDPRTHDFAAARRVAVHSEEILDRPEITSSLSAAVRTAAWVVGTSSRNVAKLPTFDARGFACEAAARVAAGQEVALVFGDERQGMTNQDLADCHALARIASAEAQPSLNLAQAFAVFAHELRVAVHAQPAAPARVAIDDARLLQLERLLGRALTAGGFLHPQTPRHALRDLMRGLQRAQLSPREWRLWMAACGELGKGLSKDEAAGDSGDSVSGISR